MPHDKNGTLLAVGDEVILHAKITQLSADEGYCNVTIESINGRRPDGLKERWSGVNTGVFIKASDGCEVVNPDPGFMGTAAIA